MPRLNVSRILRAGALAVPLAVAAGVHALSSASLRSAPEQALAIFPRNGLALERIAYRAFTDALKAELGGGVSAAAAGAATKQHSDIHGLRGIDFQSSSDGVLPTVRQALALEPLLPKAHALLAFAEADPARRRQIVALSARLNRRDLALQSLVLEQHLADRNYSGTIDTIDQILRVNPERGKEFFQLLSQALASSVTMGLFADLLAGELPWRDAFLNHAVGQSAALANLAAVRELITIDNPAFDQRLVASLAQAGDIQASARLYQHLHKPADTSVASPVLAWVSAFPPFEWKLADAPGFRAQRASAGGRLEFTVASGNGGVLASRLVAAPEAPWRIAIGHDIAPVGQTGDLTLRLTCHGAATPFFEQRFAKGQKDFTPGPAPAGCQFLELAILARAWSGAADLSGSLDGVRLIEG